MPARNGVDRRHHGGARLHRRRRRLQRRAQFLRRPMRPEPDPAQLADGLGERFEILGTNIKKWSVGSPAQSALDALTHLMQTRASRRERAGDHRASAHPIGPHRRPRAGSGRQRAASARHAADRRHADVPLGARSRAHGRSRSPGAAGKIKLVPSDELLHARPRRQAIVEMTLRDGRRALASHRRRARHRRQSDGPRPRSRPRRSISDRRARLAADRDPDSNRPRSRRGR